MPTEGAKVPPYLLRRVGSCIHTGVALHTLMQSCVLMLEAALLNYEVIMINFALFHDQVTVGTSHPALPHAVCPFCWGCHILSVLILSPTC